jgi:hypothetical protein
VNFVGLERQVGDANPQPFSFLTTEIPNKVNDFVSYLLLHLNIIHPGKSTILLCHGYNTGDPSNYSR